MEDAFQPLSTTLSWQSTRLPGPALSTKVTKPKEKIITPNLAITNQRFFHHDLRLLEEGYLSDVKVTCGNKTWDLHKIILCSRCVWFEKAFTSGFAEAQSGHVTITEFEPEKIYWLIRYIYTGILDIKELRSDNTVYAACLDLYIMGDFFDMPELRDEALSSLKTHCNSKAGELQQRQPQGEALKQIMDLEALFEGLKLAFGEDADDDNPVAKILLGFVHKTRFCLLPHPKFLELLGQVPKFSVAMMRVLYGEQYDLRGVRYPSKCANCGTSPGQGRCYDKMIPFTNQLWEARAYCNICAPTMADGADGPGGLRSAKRRNPHPSYSLEDW